MAVTIDGSAGVTTNAGGSVNPSTNIDGINYSCRAWVNFDGTKDTTGAASTANTNRLIRASGNVTSVLRNAAGDYTITFTTAMTDANYVACATTVQRQTSSVTNQSVGYYSTDDVNANTYSTTAVRISTKIGSTTGFNDTNIVSVAIFR